MAFTKDNVNNVSVNPESGSDHIRSGHGQHGGIVHCISQQQHSFVGALCQEDAQRPVGRWCVKKLSVHR